MGPPVQLLPQQSKYFHGKKTYIYFIKPEMTEGNTGFEHQLFFHTTYVNSLTSEYIHMTILFSKEMIPMNE